MNIRFGIPPVLLLLCAAALAQTPHAVTLTWADIDNPVGTTYSVYRADSPCSGTPAFAKISTTAISLKTYVDSGMTPGNYCYAVTAVYNGMESVKSPAVLAPVNAFPPSQLTIQVK